MKGHTEAIKLFADGLALVYHEARHVRFLIKNRHVPHAAWKELVNLPKKRVEAWRILQPVRQAARSKSTAREAAQLFRKRFGRSLDELQQLYDNPHWKHATYIGGHAWRHVTTAVTLLGNSIDESDPQKIERATSDLIQARHNNGCLRDKIIELDRSVEFATDDFWRETVGV